MNLSTFKISPKNNSLIHWFATVVVSTAICACGNDSVSVASTVCYNLPLDIKLLEQELNSKDIPFTKDGNCLLVNSNRENIKSAELLAFGTFPPAGLSIQNNYADFVPRLAKGGVTTTIVVWRGEEYLSWDAEDADRAEEILNIPPPMREVMRRNRNEQRSMQLQN